MPSLNSTGTGGDAAFEFVALTGMGQSTPTVAFPTVIAGNGTWLSPLLLTDGCRWLTAAVTLSQNGTLELLRFVDTAGAVARPVITGSLVAGTATILDAVDQLPCAAFQISVTNGSGIPATVSNPIVLLSAG